MTRGLKWRGGGAAGSVLWESGGARCAGLAVNLQDGRSASRKRRRRRRTSGCRKGCCWDRCGGGQPPAGGGSLEGAAGLLRQLCEARSCEQDQLLDSLLGERVIAGGFCHRLRCEMREGQLGCHDACQLLHHLAPVAAREGGRRGCGVGLVQQGDELHSCVFEVMFESVESR